MNNTTRKYLFPATLLFILTTTASANISVDLQFSGAANLAGCNTTGIQLSRNGQITVNDFSNCAGNIQSSGKNTLTFKSSNASVNCTFEGLAMDRNGKITITTNSSCRDNKQTDSTPGFQVIARSQTNHGLTGLPGTQDLSSAHHIILTGVPTANGGQPGVIQLTSNTDGQGNVTAHFNEWDYLDVIHRPEQFNYVVLEKDCFLNGNQSGFVTGSFDHKITGNNRQLDGNWQIIIPKNHYSGCAPTAPLTSVFMTPQSHQGAPITVRARNLTQNSFQAALFEDKALTLQNNQHRTDTFTIGFIAFYGNPTQTIQIDGENVQVSVKTVSVNHDWVTVPGFQPAQQIRLQEDTNPLGGYLLETIHKYETVNVLNLGNRLFAQAITFNGKQPFVPRRR